jgi:hypothetical protein
MGCVECVVVAFGNTWMTQLENRAAGPYRTRDLALQAAIAEALRIRRTGRAARVTLTDRKGTNTAQRCLCEQFPIPPLTMELR